MDERSIVVKNKARLVAQGFRQEKCIDYDEVFAPVARIEAIRLFLAFASYMGFTVYQMDVKSAFLYGTIEEEVYVHQPPGFVDPAHSNKVYKVIKALYGLHQAPRAWYETLSYFLMENGFRRGTIDKTLFTKKKKSDIIIKRQDQNFVAIGSAEDERQIKELNEDPKKKRVIKETPRKEDTVKVPAEQEVTEQGTKKRKSGHVKMIARKRPRPQPDEKLDDETHKMSKISWNNQQEWEIVRWRLYEACGVCILELKDGTVIYMLVERKYPLSKELLQQMLDLGLEVKEESTVALQLIHSSACPSAGMEVESINMTLQLTSSKSSPNEVSA
ncbi:putative ribonuclease H-like domain-containing protein [Tanacetum coccineum]